MEMGVCMISYVPDPYHLQTRELKVWQDCPFLKSRQLFLLLNVSVQVRHLPYPLHSRAVSCDCPTSPCAQIACCKWRTRSSWPAAERGDCWGASAKAARRERWPVLILSPPDPCQRGRAFPDCFWSPWQMTWSEKMK